MARYLCVLVVNMPEGNTEESRDVNSTRAYITNNGPSC
jgi:hypothetical protein